MGYATLTHPTICHHDLQHEHRQLIQRIGHFEANQNQRRDHQIKAEMHLGLETRLSQPAPGANQIRDVPEHQRVRLFLWRRMEQKGFRRRGSGAFVASLFLSGGLCFDANILSVQMPWKILIPHSTTTMADTSVAAVNTLSKEATLIVLSASYPA